MYRGNMGIFIN